MGQRGSLKGNFKIYWFERKWKYNIFNLMDTAKPVTRRKSIALNTYITKEEKSQINNLSLHLKQLGKKMSNINPNQPEKKKIIKTIAESTKLKTKTVEKNQSF